MILNIRAVPRASRNLIKKEEGCLKIYLTKPNQNGLANAQLIDLLADYLNIKRYQIKIIKGSKSRDKLVEIDEGRDSFTK